MIYSQYVLFCSTPQKMCVAGRRQRVEPAFDGGAQDVFRAPAGAPVCREGRKRGVAGVYRRQRLPRSQSAAGMRFFPGA